MALILAGFGNNTAVIESDLDGSDKLNYAPAMTELKSSEAKRLAIREAAIRGISSPGCGIPSSPYPVDAEGRPIDLTPDLTKAGEQASKIHRYRIDIPVTSVNV